LYRPRLNYNNVLYEIDVKLEKLVPDIIHGGSKVCLLIVAIT